MIPSTDSTPFPDPFTKSSPIRPIVPVSGPPGADSVPIVLPKPTRPTPARSPAAPQSPAPDPPAPDPPAPDPPAPDSPAEATIDPVEPTRQSDVAPPVAPVPTPMPTPAPPVEHADERARVNIWDVPFDALTMGQAVNAIERLIDRNVPSYVITANLNYVMLHTRQPDVAAITRDADLVLADGQPIVWRSRLSQTRLPCRVAGSELIYELAQRARDRGWPIYLLGGEPGVAQDAATGLATRYPGLQIAGVESPPFRKLSEQEAARQHERIRHSGAKLLLVAFGQPKGERWIHANFRSLGVPVSIQLGASFDFIAGTAKRAPRPFRNYGLEWLHRAMSDPKRLLPRYFSNGCFMIGALVDDWRRQVTRWGMGDWAPIDGERRVR